MEQTRELRENAARCLRLSRSIHSPEDVAFLEALSAEAIEEAEQREAAEAVRLEGRYPSVRSAEVVINRSGGDRRRAGRQDDVNSMLIPLMREGSLGRLRGELIDDEPDQLRSARGIVLWLLISVAMWVSLLWWVL
jgi:hypothetical protein